MQYKQFINAVNRLRPDLINSSKDLLNKVYPGNRQAFITVLRLGYTIQDAFCTAAKYTAYQIESYHELNKKLIK